MKRVLIAAFALAMMFAASPAGAARPDEMLADPTLEMRAEQVGRELRCLVCRNQSIEDSEADLAHDLRMLVRRRITAGDSNAQVIAYLRSRYGDYVLLRPPLEAGTVVLWVAPPAILLLGGFGLLLFYRRRNRPEAAALSPEEENTLARILGRATEP